MDSRSSILYKAMPAVGADGQNIMKLIPVLRNNAQPLPTQATVQKSNGQSYLTQTSVQIINAPSFSTQMPVPADSVSSDPTRSAVQIIDAQFFPSETPAPAANGQASQTRTPVQIVNCESFPIQTPNVRTSGPPLRAPVPVLRPTQQSFLTQIPQKVITLHNPVFQSAPPRFISRPVSDLNMLSSQICSSYGGSLNKHSPREKAVSLVGCPIEVPVPVKSPGLPESEVLNIPREAPVEGISVSKPQPARFSSKSSSPTVIYMLPATTVNQKVTQTNGGAAEKLRELAIKANPSHAVSNGGESQAFTCVLPPRKGETPKLKLIPKVPKRPNSPTRWVVEETETCTAINTSIKALSESESAFLGNLHSYSKKDTRNKTKPQNHCVTYDGRLFYISKKDSSSSDSAAATQPVPSSSQQPLKPAVTLTSEVIDLCGEDSSPSPNRPEICHGDEDNVIFLSYIPPKSKSGSAQKDQLGCGGSNGSTDVLAEGGGGQVRNMSISHDRRVYAPAEVDITESLKTKDPKRIPDRQLDTLEMDAETSSLANSNDECDPAVQNCQQSVPETSLSAPEPNERFDHQLRKIFGITADVKIPLQKIDEMPHWCVSANFPRTKPRVSVDCSEPFRNGLKMKEVSLQNFSSPDKLDVKILTEHEQSPSSHTTTPKSPDIKLNTVHHCASNKNCCSSLEMSFLREAESVIGYVEPIDEDFPDENDVLQLEDTLQTQTCVDVNTNTRRMGRTRKRTMCLCCVPTILHPVIKSATSLEEVETWMSTTDLMTKRGGRIKASRKNGRTSKKIGYPNCKVHKPPAGSSSSTASTGSTGLKGHEQMKRHNEHQAKKQHK